MSVDREAGFCKTRYLLIQALMRLLEKNSFRHISVGDICREAMVSRSSFYGYFADKYELLECAVNELMDRQMKDSQDHTLDRKVLIMFEGVQKNSRTLHNVFMADIDPEIIVMFERMFRRIVHEWLDQMKYIGEKSKGPVEMIAAFYAGGLANVVICWVRENFATPKEELALCQSRLLLRLLGDAGHNDPEKI